jgi:hypothetical protein
LGFSLTALDLREFLERDSDGRTPRTLPGDGRGGESSDKEADDN